MNYSVFYFFPQRDRSSIVTDRDLCKEKKIKITPETHPPTLVPVVVPVSTTRLAPVVLVSRTSAPVRIVPTLSGTTRRGDIRKMTSSPVSSSDDDDWYDNVATTPPDSYDSDSDSDTFTPGDGLAPKRLRVPSEETDSDPSWAGSSPSYDGSNTTSSDEDESSSHYGEPAEV